MVLAAVPGFAWITSVRELGRRPRTSDAPVAATLDRRLTLDVPGRNVTIRRSGSSPVGRSQALRAGRNPWPVVPDGPAARAGPAGTMVAATSTRSDAATPMERWTGP